MNDKIFADMLYWVGVLNPKDQWHVEAISTRKLLGDIKIITTETVLIEVLNYFSDYGSAARKSGVDAVRTIMSDDEVEYVPHTPEPFESALDLYSNRLDKSYSLSDCISMNVCREREITDILTHDDHFEQEGFTLLL